MHAGLQQLRGSGCHVHMPYCHPAEVARPALSLPTQGTRYTGGFAKASPGRQRSGFAALLIGISGLGLVVVPLAHALQQRQLGLETLNMAFLVVQPIGEKVSRTIVLSLLTSGD